MNASHFLKACFPVHAVVPSDTIKMSATKIYTKIKRHIKDPISGDADVLYEERYEREGDCDEAPVQVKK